MTEQDAVFLGSQMQPSVKGLKHNVPLKDK
jgi:hypothetical protein